MLEARCDGQQRLAGAGATIECNDAHVGVEQQVEREPLLLRTRTQAPRFGCGMGHQHELVVDAASERALRTAAQHRELVLEQLGGAGHLVASERAGGVQPIDHFVLGLHRDPPSGAGGRRPADGVVLGGLQAEMSSLDAQRRVVRNHASRCVHRLPERGADDAVVGHVGVEPVLEQEVLLDAIDLHLQRALGGRVADGDRCGERTARLHAQLLDGAQCRARSAADIVGPGLQAVELLDHRERYDHVDPGEAVQAPGVADEHRRIEHHSRSHTPLHRIVGHTAG